MENLGPAQMLRDLLAIALLGGACALPQIVYDHYEFFVPQDDKNLSW